MTRHVTISEAARTHGTPAQVWRLLGDFGNEHRWSSQRPAAVATRLRWAWARAARARWPSR